MTEMICAGFGGQGVLTLGMILATAGAKGGKNVTWIPSYGSEMRGGAANCNLKISDGEIASPYVRKIDILIALNEDSIAEFGKNVKKGGCILVNSSIVENIPEFEDVTVIQIPANDIAMKVHHPKGMSLALVGAVIAYSNVVSLDAAKEALVEYFSGKHANDELNFAVLMEGYKYLKEM